MSTHSASHRSALRVLIVLLLSVLVMLCLAPDLRRLWYPVGQLGYTTNGDGLVYAVEAGSPAARAGIVIGDSVDVAATPPQYRWYVVGDTWTWASGEQFTFAVVHRGARRIVTLTAAPEASQDALRKTFIVLNVAASVVFIFVGAALVLMRPSLVTWGFFFYCLAFSPGNWEVAEELFPYPGAYLMYALLGVLTAIGITGLLAFSVCFLAEPLSRWRRATLRLLPSVLAIQLALWFFAEYQTNWAGGFPGELLTRLGYAIQSLIAMFALFALTDTYVRARGANRQRMLWIIVSFGVSVSTSLAATLLAIWVPDAPYWLIYGLSLCSIFVPLAFGYAVIRHRVIDVSFVVNRALVYGILTSVLVAVFSLIDWFFTDYLQLARLGTVAEVVAVVAFGLWFNGLHKRVDAFVDATFFRQRHRAEVVLARNAAALPLATTDTTINHVLVAEPVRALSLASAALFRREREGMYRRQDSVGWGESDISALDAGDDHILSLALAEGGPLSLYDYPWRHYGVPTGSAHPVLMLPIVVRQRLVAVALYGAHLHGEPLDPDEISAIAQLGPAAGVAYDHLDAEAMQRENEAMRKELETLQGVIAELQIQPT